MRKASTSMLAIACLALTSMHASAATFVIVNFDQPGEGLNDTTVVAPVGGNPGTTLGQQRRNAIQAAANIWGAQLTSNVPIRIGVNFAALSCSSVGSAGSTYYRDFAGAPIPGAWYPKALAGKLLGAYPEPDRDPAADAEPVDIGYLVNNTFSTCPGNPAIYLGLDGNPGAGIDLVARTLHYLGHGLGFATATDTLTGNQKEGFPSAFDFFLQDTDSGLTWNQMTSGQRAASATNGGKLVWTGANVTAQATSVLLPGVPRLAVSGAAAGAAAGTYSIGQALFTPAVNATGVTRDIMPLSPANTLGCSPFNAADSLAVAGNIALIDRGVCPFTAKVRNAQVAGAAAVIIVENTDASPPADMGGADATFTFTIPAVRITLAAGTSIRTALARRSRTRSGVVGTIGIDNALTQGLSANGRVLMHATNPAQAGSVFHFDPSAFPNLLMEPDVVGSPHAVTAPSDLSLALLRDLGW